jgi:hypothetical protein
VRLGGDTSGKGIRGFSIQTENEFFSKLPRDVSGKADPLSIRTQDEIMSKWEQERAFNDQSQANLQWANEVVANKVRPGFMDTIIDTDSDLQVSKDQEVPFWREWKPEPDPISQPQIERMPESYSPLNPKRVYAPAPEREPFSIPGASDSALSAELRSMHPDFARRATGSDLEREIMDRFRMNNGATDSNRQPQTMMEREGSYTTIEREAMERAGRDIFTPSKIPASLRQEKPSTEIAKDVTRRKEPVPIGRISPVGISTGINQRKKQMITISPNGDTTEKIAPTSRTDISIIPYQITTPTESKTTTTVPEVTPTPWEKITPYEQPTKTVTPVPPVPVIPIVPIPIPGLPWGGGGGGSGGSPIGRGRLKRELFSYAPVNLKILEGPKAPAQRKPAKTVYGSSAGSFKTHSGTVRVVPLPTRKPRGKK